MNLTIAILAGGESRRMGRDKASISVAGETLLERTARIASVTGMSVLVVGRPEPENWPHTGAAFCADHYPGLGPLGGLATALHCAERSLLLLPCDMPFLTGDVLVWLAAAALRSPPDHGLIARNGGRIEPLFAFYPLSLLPVVEEHLRQKLLAMHHLIAAGQFGFADVPAEHVPALRNVNRPEDWPADSR